MLSTRASQWPHAAGRFRTRNFEELFRRQAAGLCTVGLHDSIAMERHEASQPGQSECTIAVFDYGGAVFNPITGIAVGNAINLDMLWGVDVAADDSVDTSMTSMSYDLTLKMANMLPERLESSLQTCDEGIISVQGCGRGSAPDRVCAQHCFIEQTQKSHGHAGGSFKVVELVAVHDEELSSISRLVMKFFGNLHHS